MTEGDSTVEHRLTALAERLAVLERRANEVSTLEQVFKTALEGKGGILDRLAHLDECIDGVKKTIWFASGGLALLVVLVNVAFKH